MRSDKTDFVSTTCSYRSKCFYLVRGQQQRFGEKVKHPRMLFRCFLFLLCIILLIIEIQLHFSCLLRFTVEEHCKQQIEKHPCMLVTTTFVSQNDVFVRRHEQHQERTAVYTHSYKCLRSTWRQKQKSEGMPRLRTRFMVSSLKLKYRVSDLWRRLKYKLCPSVHLHSGLTNVFLLPMCMKTTADISHPSRTVIQYSTTSKCNWRAFNKILGCWS